MEPVLVEELAGSGSPAHYFLAETIDADATTGDGGRGKEVGRV